MLAEVKRFVDFVNNLDEAAGKEGMIAPGPSIGLG
jgi:hypothetical protein